MGRHISDEDAKNYMARHAEKDPEGYSRVERVEYIGTFPGIRETCGGCTIGDGRDCWPPRHYVDEFYVVCSNLSTENDLRFSNLSIGWSEGDKDCSAAFGDYSHVFTIKYADTGHVGHPQFTSSPNRPT